MVAVGVTLLFWSSAFVAIRHLGPSFSPGSLSLGRLLVGSVALGVMVALRGFRVPRRRDWPGLVTIGVLWFGVYNVALNAGEHRVDAGTAAMLIQLSPVLVAVLAAVFLKERATLALGIGLVVAFAGVVLIATSTSGSGRYDPLGVVLCLVSAAAYAVSLTVQKPLVSRLSGVEVTWIACTVGVLTCLPFAGDLVHDVSGASAADIGWVVFLGLFPTAIAFSTYAYALSHMSAGNLSVTTYLVPPITVLLSWALLSEVPPAMAYVGGALCLVGVALARRKPRKHADLLAGEPERVAS
ncbi:MAG: DMT family transporter [Nocardioidaceae bacterium]|nr:DMT family transporter [Nocardioidaceae bacterium]NUS50298.1 DMT family transporter [Nocardioidaceae bacterium]